MRFHARFPYANIADDPLADFWHQLDTVFTFEGNVIVERVEFFQKTTGKQVVGTL